MQSGARLDLPIKLPVLQTYPNNSASNKLDSGRRYKIQFQ
jgi:hypothetical protein